MHDENEIWDEFKWEEFMKEQDKKVDRYMELFYRSHDNPGRNELIKQEMEFGWLLGDNDEQEFFTQDEVKVDEGEEWKTIAGIGCNNNNELHQPNYLPVYYAAHEFAIRAFRFIDQLPEHFGNDSAVVDFVSNAMIASAKIVGGMGVGTDVEELGGNIAYCKRGLAAANRVIDALNEMKGKKIVSGQFYFSLQDEAIEVRNAIAVHILDLREKFKRGV